MVVYCARQDKINPMVDTGFWHHHLLESNALLIHQTLKLDIVFSLNQRGHPNSLDLLLFGPSSHIQHIQNPHSGICSPRVNNCKRLSIHRKMVADWPIVITSTVSRPDQEWGTTIWRPIPKVLLHLLIFNCRPSWPWMLLGQNLTHWKLWIPGICACMNPFSAWISKPLALVVSWSTLISLWGWSQILAQLVFHQKGGLRSGYSPFLSDPSPIIGNACH